MKDGARGRTNTDKMVKCNLTLSFSYSVESVYYMKEALILLCLIYGGSSGPMVREARAWDQHRPGPSTDLGPGPHNNNNNHQAENDPSGFCIILLTEGHRPPPRPL